MFAAQNAWSAAVDAPDAVSEVIVTGAKQEANSGTKSNTPLIETPQSISVINRDELDLRVVTDLNQALYYTAGVSPDTRGATASRYDLLQLRGFTPDQYLDGLKLIASAAYAVPQVDITTLDKVEVVKGPASVLYGQASPGGLVALSSKLPTTTAFGEATLSGGSFGYVQGALDLGGPIDADGKFLFRINGMIDHSDGQVNDSPSERYTINPSLTWRPDSKTTWTLLYSYQNDPKAGSYGSAPLQGTLLPNPKGTVPEDFYDGEPAYEKFQREQNAVSSFFTRDLGSGWTFRQNSRFMDVTTHYGSVYSFGLDADYTTLNRYFYGADERVDNLTLDNQVTGSFVTGPVTHNVIFGVDYQHTSQNELATGGSASSIDLFNPVYGGTVTGLYTSYNVRLNLEQTGVYAQDQLALDHWRLMLSGRYDWVDSSQFDKTGLTTTSMSVGKFTGRAGLLYLFDDGLAPYASYSTSFEPQTSETATGQVLAPTQGKQAEVGVKYQPKVWDTLVTLSVYDLRETNVATPDPNDPNASIAAGEVRSRGIELEGHTRPLPNVELSGSYTYIDNMVTKSNDATDPVGTRPYGVPQETANAFGVYTWRSGILQDLGLGGGVRYLGQSFNGATGAGYAKLPPATLFDLIGKYDFSHINPALRGVTMDVNVTNLFGARYISSCYSTYWCWYGAERTAQATVRYRW
ncbi:MAG: TonB-dependent siderophore receptor [Caulobacteraceae bacterium]